MSFGGSVAAMISSMKNNRKLLSQRKTFKDQKKESKFRIGKALKYKELPEEKLQEVKARIKAKAKKQQILRISILLVVFVGISVSIIAFVNRLNTNYISSNKEEWLAEEKRKEEAERSTENRKLYFLNKGYELMAKGNYSEAKYCFYKAKRLDKEDYHSNIAYSKSFVYDCVYNGKDCVGIDVLLRNLKEKFGNKSEVKELTQLYEESILSKKES